jgi:hypothetical protein
VREVKVVVFWEKARNPSAGMVGRKERLSDVSFSGIQEISPRIALMSPQNNERSREMRFVNLWKRRGRKGHIDSRIARENWRRLVIERNCLDTTDRDLK